MCSTQCWILIFVENIIQEKSSDSEDAAWQKMEELKLKGEEPRAARKHGSTGRTVPAGTVENDIEETHPGAIAETLKAADQITGQTFNDIGRIDEEGAIRIERKEDGYGKM